MAASPTLALKSREIIGTDAFSRRREVFGQHDTVFLPSPPVSPSPRKRTDDTPHFRRTAAYSSVRETRRDDIRNQLGFRERKMSDNSAAQRSDDVDYRSSLTERTRRLSKLRRDFLTSNLHESTPTADPFARAGTRASMPSKSSGGTYKITNGTIYKFPFAEPFCTPPPSRKVLVGSGPADIEANGNDAPESDAVDTPKVRQSLSNHEGDRVDHHKLFTELVKRYSPQQKPIDWALPPTKPRVVAALHKQNSVGASEDQVKVADLKDEKLEFSDDKLEITEENDKTADENDASHNEISNENTQKKVNDDDDAMEIPSTEKRQMNGLLKDSSEDNDEKVNTVPELSHISRQNSHGSPIKKNITAEDTIPVLLEKISKETTDKTNDTKKVKRKRSFLDKLLNRNKK